MGQDTAWDLNLDKLRVLLVERTGTRSSKDPACVSQKSRELFGPENISGHFSGVFFGFEKVFLKTSESVPIFSGIFSGRSYFES